MTGPTALFITGTDTGCGKTIVTATLARALASRGYDVGVCKPYASGIALEAPEETSDIVFLQKAAGLREPIDLVCPARFSLPLAPAQAEPLENIRYTPEEICQRVQEYVKLHEITLVEGIGGAAVPLTHNYLVSDFIKDLGLPVLVVARSALGTINHTILTVEHLRNKGLSVLGVIFNRVTGGELSEAEKGGPPLAATLAGVPFLGVVPFVGEEKVDSLPAVQQLPITCEAIVNTLRLLGTLR